MTNLNERKLQLESEIAKLQAELLEVNKQIRSSKSEEVSYTKFEVGKKYFIVLSSYANKKSVFECTAIKEGKVKGSMDGKAAKWYDIVLQKKLRNGKLCEIETEAFTPDKRVANFVKANQELKG